MYNYVLIIITHYICILLSCHNTEKSVLHCVRGGAQVPAQVCCATQRTGHPGNTSEHRSDMGYTCTVYTSAQVLYMYMYKRVCYIMCMYIISYTRCVHNYVHVERYRAFWCLTVIKLIKDRKVILFKVFYLESGSFLPINCMGLELIWFPSYRTVTKFG